MQWLGAWSALVLAGGLLAAIAINRRRFARRVAAETGALWRATFERRAIAANELERLPPPVRRYLRKAIAAHHAAGSARLKHGGTFRPRLDGDWFPIRGEQYIAAESPGFVWWGRVRLAPGITIDALDRCVDGAGSMLVRALSSVTLVDQRGPELDRSALLRLLGELTWIPSVFLDPRYVTWSALDEYRASATLTVGNRSVSGLFEFGTDDLPRTFTAERQRAVQGGRSVLTPFTGEYRAFREIGGFVVPTQLIGYWHVDGQRMPYARFQLERLEYDVRAAFGAGSQDLHDDDSAAHPPTPRRAVV